MRFLRTLGLLCSRNRFDCLPVCISVRLLFCLFVSLIVIVSLPLSISIYHSFSFNHPLPAFCYRHNAQTEENLILKSRVSQ